MAYTWDGYGNLEERQDSNQNLTETLQYDDLNRLHQSTVTNPGGNGPGSQYNYDATGNITTRTIAGTSETYNYDPNHPYAVASVTSGGSTVYSASYNADGNMTSRNGYPITWTPGNLPASIAGASGSSTFSYDPDHQRYYQAGTFNGVTTDTTYVGRLFEVVSTASSTEYRHNIMADGQVIAVHTITGAGAVSTSYLHYDHLGSVDAITDDSGTVIQSMSFDAFGLRRGAGNWTYDLTQAQIAGLKSTTDRGYTNQEELDNLSLVHMNGRVYDPTVGRFISSDPIEGGNRYAYVDDSPLENTDPSGFVCHNGNLTEACQQMDGGAGGYTTGGGTGDAGADPYGDGGGGFDQNNAHLPNCAGDQITGCIAQLGKIEVTAPYFTLHPINYLFYTDVFSYSNPSVWGPRNNGTEPSSPGTKSSSQTPQQKPKQQPKQSCNKGIVKGANFAYDFGASMQKTAGAGMLLASPAVETPPGAALEASAVAVGAGGVVLQGTAGLVLLYETGDISPVQNSTIVFAVSFVGDFMVGQPGEAVADVAVGNFLGDSTASCPGQ